MSAYCARCNTGVSEASADRRFRCPVCGRRLTEVQAALGRMEEEGWNEYVSDLRRLDAPRWSATDRPAGVLLGFTRDDAGHPLGRGYPVGRSLREDGETHRRAWMRVVRADPCSYCGRRAGTVDHVEPQSRPARGIGGAHSWVNYAAACAACNGRKSTTSLIMFLAVRAGCAGARLEHA